MRQASVAGWTSLSAVFVSAAVLSLMLYRGLAEPAAGETLSLSTFGWVILISSLACLAVSIVLAAFVRFYHSSAKPGPSVVTQAAAGHVAATDRVEADEEISSPDLSLLPEDERRLYEIIDEAGGEILQMKLVSSGEFSKSKVTRLLDKLERRGLVKRERRGMTNLVKLMR